MDSNDKTLMNASGARPTHVRYWVIVFAVTLSVITYIDRVCISQAAPIMSKDLGFSTKQMGWAFSAFFWAYALFEIPSGWLGDRIGARKVLMRVVMWWSFFTAATGWVFNLISLADNPRNVRRRRGGMFPQSDKGVYRLASEIRTGSRPGHNVAKRKMGRRIHAFIGSADFAAYFLASHLRIVRPAGRDMGNLFLYLVSGQPP